MTTQAVNKQPGGLMDEKKPTTSRAFRAWAEVQDELQAAETLGLNVSELINQVLKKHFSEHMKVEARKRKAELDKAFSALVG
jgi:hypothetical protein